MSDIQDRTGARQPELFSPERAARLDDPAREEYMPAGAIVARLEVPQEGRVIDLGAGTGRYTFAIAKAHPDAFVVAVDTQPGFVRIIAERCLEGKFDNVVTGDTPAGPPADRILLLNVLHEMTDLDLNPVRAALSPEGWMLVIDWDGGIERPVGPPREHSHTRDEAIARLQSRGFARVEPIEAPEFPYHFVLRART